MESRNQRIKAIFSAALELTTPPDRDACLRRACGNDQALRREVERFLLQAHEQAGGFLTLHPEGPAAAVEDQTKLEQLLSPCLFPQKRTAPFPCQTKD